MKIRPEVISKQIQIWYISVSKETNQATSNLHLLKANLSVSNNSTYQQ